MKNIILAIESSCDDTSVALMQDNQLLSHVVNSQKIHKDYGGVVPELASRTHQKHIVPIVQKALQQARLHLQNLTHIAFTQGPGLLGSLLVGSCFAKGLSYALNLPLVAIHHMKAHVLANFIQDPKPTFPFLALIVSGGHTQLILVKDYTTMQLLGETQDDAMGEALDKIGKMMGLPYPGGVSIDKYAQQGDPTKFTFPKTKMPGLDLSFSGIKTAFLYFLHKHQAKDPNFVQTYRHDLCASIQASLIEMVVAKIEQAITLTGAKQLVLGGGVAANSALRQRLELLATQRDILLFIPQPTYCTDNAAMIAIAAYYQIQAGDLADYTIPSLPRMPF